MKTLFWAFGLATLAAAIAVAMQGNGGSIVALVPPLPCIATAIAAARVANPKAQNRVFTGGVPRRVQDAAAARAARRAPRVSSSDGRAVPTAAAAVARSKAAAATTSGWPASK